MLFQLYLHYHCNFELLVSGWLSLAPVSVVEEDTLLLLVMTGGMQKKSLTAVDFPATVTSGRWHEIFRINSVFHSYDSNSM